VPVEVGATAAPTDLNVWGTLAASLPSPPIHDDFKRGLDQAWEMNAGAAEALGELALNTAKLLVLNTATFGGYGAYQTGSAIWAGYQEDGIPGALNAVNPFYHFLRAGLDTYAAVVAGDHRAIGAHGLTTLVLGAAAVVGIANGVAALAEAAAARGAAAGTGAVGQGVTGAIGRAANYRDVFFAAHPELRGQVVVHHAVEQQILKRYPGLFTEAEIHSLRNLRGIPKTVNPDLHLSQIRRAWNEFYRTHASPSRRQVLDFASVLDARFGVTFQPPR
jgi:hypothetical protein